jgi:hypothetical protein
MFEIGTWIWTRWRKVMLQRMLNSVRLLNLYFDRTNSHYPDPSPSKSSSAEPSLLPHLTNLDLLPSSSRTMSGLEIISAGWVICNSWGGLAATFSLAIIQGGPITMIYGPIIMFVLVGLCAATLAELASVYPTAGGQYHWTSILAPKGWSRGIVRITHLSFAFRAALLRLSSDSRKKKEMILFSSI